jgi:hypothetical protein
VRYIDFLDGKNRVKMDIDKLWKTAKSLYQQGRQEIKSGLPVPENNKQLKYTSAMWKNTDSGEIVGFQLLDCGFWSNKFDGSQQPGEIGQSYNNLCRMFPQH